MLGFLRYMFFSGNKAVYRSIAREFQTSSFRVYRLAHGKRAKTNKDYQILKHLQKQEIIEGVLQVG
ncbi:hypothetical protein [uncultured Proteiniphilum sp.]|uniref:hypothetical protein n=1 Tax=uncultured Proteiniphilum sp. TaxID=497637 RepID=UPI00260B9E00|nr:hypothetical protein [uncultured Proteiniphilum sp.]